MRTGITPILIVAGLVAVLTAPVPVAFANSTTVSIQDVTAPAGGTVTIPIMLEGIVDYGTGTLNITYDPSVVHVIAVESGPDSTVTASNIDNTGGITRISAWNLHGVSGDIIFANLTLEAIGDAGDSTELGLEVVTLKDISYKDILADTYPGRFTIAGSEATETSTPTVTPTSTKKVTPVQPTPTITTSPTQTPPPEPSPTKTVGFGGMITLLGLLIAYICIALRR